MSVGEEIFDPAVLPADPGGPHANGTAPRIDPALVRLVAEEYGLEGLEGQDLAELVGSRIRSERATGLARRTVRDAQLVREADLNTIPVLNVDSLLARAREPRLPVFGELLATGHNATAVARWKVGKSTLADNMAMAAVVGGLFLARFEVPAPLRVMLFNYELHEDDMADRLARLNLPAEARERLAVANLRGRRLPLMTEPGRDQVVRWLLDHGAELWIVDPFGAAFAAAGGESENDNAEVRRFLIALDEIKRLAGCETLVMPVHSGRGEPAEGEEQGRGATVLEDWPDVRMILTKDKDGRRFLRTEGRAWELSESRLGFDEESRRLMLAGDDVGMNRRRVRAADHVVAVVRVVRSEPGLSKRDLRDRLGAAGVSNTQDQDAAVQAARGGRHVHVHAGDHGAHRHFPGPEHVEDEDCSGGLEG